MDYEISIYEYGIKEYMLKFNNEDMTEKAYEIVEEYFNRHLSSIDILDINIEKEECEIYIVCNLFHLYGIYDALKEKLDIDGDWV